MSTLNNNKISYFAPRGAPPVIKTAEVRNKQAIRRTTSQALQRTLSKPAIEMFEGSIEVDAAPEEVYQVASNFKEYPKWTKGIKSVNVVHDNHGTAPQIVKLDMSMYGMSHVNTMKYEFDSPKKLSWVMTDGGVKSLNGNYEFKPLPNGHTQVTFHLNIEPGIPIPHMVKKMATKSLVNSAVKELKKYTEDHFPHPHPA
eukprot:CAMPEP_0181310362 /NCGR_PEP_ID=MMETSP1101-20121128/12546_1 /TAXON_ID=46948 /ORGANISM="Rhodomonas abbreviata, Strain Caron Lab Isolate" /LENGTH=198 /DNA_ID=CAMNT_0023416987 /DNA_START=363 /DNA_END=959 /DNA_ORIENTATION=+